MIKFPIRTERAPSARFAYLVDATQRIFAGAILPEDAEQLVAAANAGAKLRSQPLEKQPRRKNARQKIAEEYRESDILAKEMDRRDIVYGHYDDLPQAGEYIARVRKQ